MGERRAAKSDGASRTMAEVRLVLKEARQRTMAGDISGINEQVQQINRLFQGEDGVEAGLLDDLTPMRNLWLETLTDLVPMLETQKAYKEALTCTRILHQYDPSREADLRRLIHLYVLSGSRADALDAMRRRFDQAVQGQGSLALIRGVAGIGKTSLAQVCAAWTGRQNTTFARGRCYEYGVTLPFSPWQEVLASLAETTGVTPEALPAPFGNGPPVQAADALIQTFTTYLHQLASEQPLVLLLDDLHWADQDTLNLLEYVTRHIRSLPLLILITYRSEEIQPGHPLYAFLPILQRDRPTETIRLTALDLDDTRRLIESHLGPCSLGLVHYLQERAEGHPLFLVELLSDLAEEELLTQDSRGRWLPPAQDMPVPTLLRQVIAQRVARLDHQGEEMLNVAAVVGETWELPVVEAILKWPEDALLAALESALTARLVESEDERRERYRFSHGLIQEVLYRRQLPRRRRKVHSQIGVLLEEQLHRDSGSSDANYSDRVGAVAHHYYQAERWSQAFEYSREAGDIAYQRYALHSVVKLYNQALDAARQAGHAIAPDLRLKPYEKLGEAHYLLNQKEEAVKTYTQMVEVARAANDKTAEAHALFRLADSQERMYTPDRSAQTRHTALELAKEIAEPSLLALNHLNLGHHYLTTGDLNQTQHHLVEAERFARTSDKNLLLMESLRYQAYVAIFWGEYSKANQLAQDVFERAQATSNAPIRVNACWLHGFALTEQGHYERARGVLLKGLDTVDEIGEYHYYLNRLRNSLGYLHRELGDFETAMRWNQRALAENQQDNTIRSYECACYSLLDLATNQLEAGQPEAAMAYFQEFETVFSQADYAWYRYSNRAQLFQAELALAQGAYVRALEHVAKATQLAQAKTMRKNVVKSLLYRGQALLGLQRQEEAVTNLQQAVTLADQIGHAGLRWKTRLQLAKAFARQGRPNEALYREARAMVNDIADNLQNPHLKSTFLNLPLVVALHKKAQHLTETFETQELLVGLTPREIEVLRLVAQGLTDRQISETLHIAVRTVNTHVTNILNKTGCENRTAAATFAAQNNLI